MGKFLINILDTYFLHFPQIISVMNQKAMRTPQHSRPLDHSSKAEGNGENDTLKSKIMLLQVTKTTM